MSETNTTSAPAPATTSAGNGGEKKPPAIKATAVAEEHKLIPLREDLWTYEGFRFGRHEVTPDPRTHREDLLLGEYWANIAAKLAPGARIEAHWQDGSAYGEYYVRRKSGNFVEVFELLYVKFPGMSDMPKNLPNYKVEFAGPAALWRVIRISDKRVMKDRFTDEFTAYAWLRQQPFAREKAA